MKIKYGLLSLAVVFLVGCTPVDRSGASRGNEDVNCRGVMEERVRDCARDAGSQMDTEEEKQRRALEMMGEKDE